MTTSLRDLVGRQAAGEAVGITSVCSAHPLVIEAAVLQALRDDGHVLVEATSNQVDQDGGYTGMTPRQFADLVARIAREHGLPADRILLGGDHLGPNVWRANGSEDAMARAEVLVHDYVAAGFAKIHLDCSMACADDDGPPTDEVVAARAARLARVAELAAARSGHAGRPVYVIGTEVPVPGGAHESIEVLAPTSAAAAEATVTAHRRAFEIAGISTAWDRVIALVVQPGVEFDHARVVDYDPGATSELRQVAARAGLVFEAHSTDYQTPEALQALVRDHWAILKVGPGLTWAMREALFALAGIEAELVPAERQSRLPQVVEDRMLAEPRWWQGYYAGGADQQRLARRYSYSDRMRYYWPDPEIDTATELLLRNLSETPIPEPMLSAALPAQYARVRAGTLAPHPRALVVDHVGDVLRDYARACGADQEVQAR